MLEKVRGDRSLPVTIRSRAWKIAADVTRPARSLQKLQGLAEETLPLVERELPTTGLTRIVSAGTFWKHHASNEVREAFTTVDDFVQYLITSDDPSGELHRMLAPDSPVIPWQRSWLAPTGRIRGLDGRSLIAALELGADAEPPFVAFHLPLQQMIASGVLVRPPCSLDSVLGPNPQWSPTGLASGIDEFVDGDVPLAAVGHVEWVM